MTTHSNHSKRPASHRVSRMADLIREEVAGFMTKGNKDPRIHFVTITQVQMTGDLHIARVYYSALGSEKEIAETEEGLHESVGIVRNHLAKNLRLRTVPRVEFHFDEGLQHSYRVQELLGGISHPVAERDEK